MKATRTVQKILANYEGETPGVKAQLCRMLMTGRLGGTGKMIILPVDQGFEHGPARSFAANPAAYDPHYHYQIALDAGLNAYAAPLGMIEAGADTFAGQIPTILKCNSANSLIPEAAPKDQAITASVDDALRLGCSAIGFTIYPGSAAGLDMFEEISAMREEAARKGVATVIWSYPRGEDLSKAGETAIDVAAYAAQIAALLGAHIIKIKLSTDHLEQGAAGASWSSPAARPRARTRSTTTPARSATAAATARSSAATPSSARATRPSPCSASSSTSTRAATDRPRRTPRDVPADLPRGGSGGGRVTAFAPGPPISVRLGPRESGIPTASDFCHDRANGQTTVATG